MVWQRVILLTFANNCDMLPTKLQAPEIGTYNEKWGAGLGVEQMGVTPDIVVDNNPRTSYDGIDTQLEHAIEFLKTWLEEEPVVVPLAPKHKRNMAYSDGSCATRQ